MPAAVSPPPRASKTRTWLNLRTSLDDNHLQGEGSSCNRLLIDIRFIPRLSRRRGATLLFPLYAFVYFLPINCDAFRCAYPQCDLVPLDTRHCHGDFIS